MADMEFALKAFVLLGIERILYSYWYIYPKYFEKSVRKGNFGGRLQAEPLLWKVAMILGKYIKIIQFPVIIFDLLTRNELNWNPIIANYGEDNDMQNALLKAGGGVILLFIGQGLNIAVFKALKPIGVYYGYEFGYEVQLVNCFPYNMGIPDPQYWGVVICIWGIYLMLGATSFIVPMLETFWYVMSMQVLENPRGRHFAWKVLGKDLKKE
jgi:hypothetical protein